MTLFLKSPREVAELLAKRAKAKRLSLNLSQRSLSERSGVSFGVIKKFERTGKISLESLLKLSLILDALEDFDPLFKHKEKITSIDTLLQDTSRKRGRR